MSNNFGWIPGPNHDISYEEGLAMIDTFYEHPGPSASSNTTTNTFMSASTVDSSKIAAQALTADEARTAAAIAQLSHSPVTTRPPHNTPILPSSPPRDHQSPWPRVYHQPHWTHETPIHFTSSPAAVTKAPPPTPATSFPAPTTPAPFAAVTSHFKPPPSPLQSKNTSPVLAVSSKAPSPTLTASSKALSPTPTASSKAISPVLTATPTPVPIPKSSNTSKARAPSNGPNKAAKKSTTDSPSASASTRALKKQRCTRCVKQHGACDLDVRHPCDRCKRAGLSATDCIPRPDNVPIRGKGATAGGAVQSPPLKKDS